MGFREVTGEIQLDEPPVRFREVTGEITLDTPALPDKPETAPQQIAEAPTAAQNLPETLQVPGIGDTGIKLSPKTSAFLVGLGYGATDIYRGIKQIFGADKKEMKADAKLMEVLRADPEVGKYATGGQFAGTMVDPIGLALPVAKGKSILQMAKIGAGVGAVTGGLGYVEEGRTRAENVALGAGAGAVLMPTVGGITNIVRKMRGKKLIPLRAEPAKKPTRFREVKGDIKLDEVPQGKPTTFREVPPDIILDRPPSDTKVVMVEAPYVKGLGDIPPAPKPPVKREVPQAKLEALQSKLGKPKLQKPRETKLSKKSTIDLGKDILKDINESMGQVGAVGDVPKTPKQVAAAKRAQEGMMDMRRRAKNAGKSTAGYLKSLGYSKVNAERMMRAVGIIEGKEISAVGKAKIASEKLAMKRMVESKQKILRDKAVRTEQLKMLKGGIQIRDKATAVLGKERNVASIKLQKAVRTEQNKALREVMKVRSKLRYNIERLKDEKITMAQVKKDIYQMTTEALPPKSRGLLLKSVETAKTKKDFYKAFARVAGESEKIVRKEITAGIDKTLQNIESIPLKWQDKITESLQDINLKGMSQKTVSKLEGLKQFLAENPAEFLKFGKKTTKLAGRIGRLEKQNISDMELRDLIKLNSRISQAYGEGKLAKQLIENAKTLAQSKTLDAIEASSRNMDVAIKRPVAVKPIAFKLTKKSTWDIALSEASQSISDGYMKYVTSDVGFEVLDKNRRFGANWRTFKEPFDKAHENYKEMSTGIIDRYFNFKEGVEKQFGRKFQDYEMERIMIYATDMQEGGRLKLLNSGIDEETINFIKLTPSEKKLYEYVRIQYDALRPSIDKTMQEVYGTRLDKVDNYVSWQTDFDNSDKVFDRIKDDYVRTSKTRQGFTKSRVFGGKQVIKLNFEEVFVKHVHDSTYFANTEPVLNKIGKIARDTQYATAVGKKGQQWTQEWIDLMARKGVPEGYKPGALNTFNNAIGAGVLGFRLSPIIKQPLAKIDAMALIGKDAFIHDKDFFSKGLWDSIHKISKQQRFRTLDDPAYVEFAKNKKLAKWQKAGYAGIRWTDQITADTVWYGAYRRYLADNGYAFNMADFKAVKFINLDGVRFADYITRRTQGSAEYKDLAKLLTGKNKDIARTLFKFQTFVYNASILLPHDAINVAARTEKDYGKALGIAMAVGVAGLTEDYVTSGIAQIFSPEQYAKKEREKKFTARLFDGLVGKIPVVSNIYGAWKYDSVGLPIVDIASTGLKGAKSMVTGKRPETKAKGLIRMLEAVAVMSGIPGAGQAGQIIRKGIDELSAKPKNNRPRAIRK